MLSPDMLSLSVSPLDLIARTVVVYIVVLGLMRIAGKRQIAQLGPTELVAMLLISNAVQNSMNAGDDSLLGGLISATTLVLLSRLITFLTFHNHSVSALIEGRPITLVLNGKLQRPALKKILMTPSQLRGLLMLQGVEDLAQVRRAVMDAEGRLLISHEGFRSDDPAFEHPTGYGS